MDGWQKPITKQLKKAQLAQARMQQSDEQADLRWSVKGKGGGKAGSYGAAPLGLRSLPPLRRKDPGLQPLRTMRTMPEHAFVSTHEGLTKTAEGIHTDLQQFTASRCALNLRDRRSHPWKPPRAEPVFGGGVRDSTSVRSSWQCLNLRRNRMSTATRR